MNEYDNQYVCPVCGGPNKVRVTEMIDHMLCEASTECKKCGHCDYWAYGFYESDKEE